MKVIYYTTLSTASKNIYLELRNEDQVWLLGELVRAQSFMSELSMSKNPILKQVVRWWITGNKQYPYSGTWKKNNSPQSFCSGLVNNLLYGTQRNFSLQQITVVGEILNAVMELQQQIKTDYDLDLQPTAQLEPIEFVHRL